MDTMFAIEEYDEILRTIEAFENAFPSPPEDLLKSAYASLEVPYTAPAHTKVLPSVEEVLFSNDGSEKLGSVLVENELISQEHVDLALENVRRTQRAFTENPNYNGMGASLLHEVVELSGVKVDLLLSKLIDVTKHFYLPLENYTIDHSIVRLLPERLNIQRLVVPFDVVSGTAMIAICNPFDEALKEAVQNLLDYHIEWYLAKPCDIQQVLKNVYSLS